MVDAINKLFKSLFFVSLLTVGGNLEQENVNSKLNNSYNASNQIKCVCVWVHFLVGQNSELGTFGIF